MRCMLFSCIFMCTGQESRHFDSFVCLLMHENIDLLLIGLNYLSNQSFRQHTNYDILESDLHLNIKNTRDRRLSAGCFWIATHSIFVFGILEYDFIFISALWYKRYENCNWLLISIDAWNSKFKKISFLSNLLVILISNLILH